MDFREATEGIPSRVLATAFRVEPQTVRQYRLDPSSDGHRSPPKGWQAIVARILQDRGDEYRERAAAVMADALDE